MVLGSKLLPKPWGLLLLGSKVLPKPWGLLLLFCGASAMVDSEPTCISAVAATALEDGAPSCSLLQREGHAVALANNQTAKQTTAGSKLSTTEFGKSAVPGAATTPEAGGGGAARVPGLPENSSRPSAAASDGAASGGSARPGAHLLQSEAELPKNGSQSPAASEGAGSGGSAGPGANLSSAAPAVERAHVGRHLKSPVVLIVIEMFPPAWLLGIDRFYLGSTRTGIAKLIFSAATFSVGGFIWGLIDCGTVLVNTLQRRGGIHSLGMAANFEHDQLQAAFYLALALIPVLAMETGIWRLFLQWRRAGKLRRLKDAASKSPHIGRFKNFAPTKK